VVSLYQGDSSGGPSDDSQSSWDKVESHRDPEMGRPVEASHMEIERAEKLYSVVEAQL
jgi:hypothetical protein